MDLADLVVEIMSIVFIFTSYIFSAREEKYKAHTHTLGGKAMAIAIQGFLSLSLCVS